MGDYLFPDIFQIFRAFSYLPLFWLGFKIRQYNGKWLNKIPVIIWVLLHIGLFILTKYMSGVDNLIFKFLTIGLNFVVHIVGALMVFYSLQKLANNINWKNNKFFNLLSKSSMPIYLFHQQVVYLFIWGLNGLINPYVHTLINFIGVMIISLLISTIMLRFKTTRFLLGEK